MSPQQQQLNNGKRDNYQSSTINTNNDGKALCPPPLKINKDSHSIRKSSSSNISSPSSSSSSTTSFVNGIAAAAAAAAAAAGSTKPPQRHPVIIYTHSPKVIHTHPRDFMALVQKLTGMSRSDDEASPKATKSAEENKGSKAVVSDDNESSSVVTDENCCSGGVVEGQVNSCFAPPIFEPPPPPPPPQLANSYLTNIPVYRPNSTDFLCSNQPFFNYDDSLLFGAPSIHSLSSTNSALNGINDFCEYSEY